MTLDLPENPIDAIRALLQAAAHRCKLAQTASGLRNVDDALAQTEDVCQEMVRLINSAIDDDEADQTEREQEALDAWISRSGCTYAEGRAV